MSSPLPRACNFGALLSQPTHRGGSAVRFLQKACSPWKACRALHVSGSQLKPQDEPSKAIPRRSFSLLRLLSSSWVQLPAGVALGIGIGYSLPALLSSPSSCVSLATVGLGVVAMQDRRLSSRMRRSLFVRAAVRLLHRLSYSSVCSSSPLIATCIWYLRNGFHANHWLRDDSDYLRPLVSSILQRRQHVFSPTAQFTLGHAISAEEVTELGDRRLRLIYAVLLPPTEGEKAEGEDAPGDAEETRREEGDVKLYVIADGNSRLPNPLSVALVSDKGCWQLMGKSEDLAIRDASYIQFGDLTSKRWDSLDQESEKSGDAQDKTMEKKGD
ncbi:hypothetical protein GUITHDRAFT_103454 [Guillardia theta CCMP2712]|uniref:Uncharacterized protein n=1 Tax=Guillardia theta (strain CCMP2712) TaxID=905079 RepID=L1JRG0_GUITC|nr:hypothetical protein GUITHDRAFT_103454 [Guillardia theta CCMP2712]EKX50864.1 hypothetical protein GUITHDRAFT_103454 [Guillardia theta CCMP2712]|eukprot:XP_005837844.1 hypothetical protein GUITHDRAFT_103454 [Guillardia theta CCMP2712]